MTGGIRARESVARGFEVRLEGADIVMLVEALDAYEYWQLGDVLPRNNGEVWIPGDSFAEPDRYWGEEPMPTSEQAAAIEQVKACRQLADYLRAESDETHADAER